MGIGGVVNLEFVEALRELERERGISFEILLHGMEEALASAWKSTTHEELDEDLEDARAQVDAETGDISMFVRAFDEDGNLIEEREVEVSDDFLGRIAAQTAKQVILQKIRDAEREMTYEEFAGREGDVVTGIVQQDSHRYTLLDLGKVEALLPVQEQVPSEPYRHGERLKAYIVEVRKGTKGPQIIVSRTHPNLLRALFDLEVPEVREGVVEIKAVAREPGHRSKVAVASNEPGVDPVGACVGTKGARVRQVVGELKGEKIDVVEWSDELERFVANALAPAKVNRVVIDEDSKTALAIVPDYQLSLAIGKEGQNARLAARLTGYRIDIKSETQAAEEAAAPPAPVATTEPSEPEEKPKAEEVAEVPEDVPDTPEEAVADQVEEVAEAEVAEAEAEAEPGSEEAKAEAGEQPEPPEDREAEPVAGEAEER
ncbi:MAG TPA: transcription termination factor NusA [Actinomycetota bacterium]|nr:transcription termination factor NusA [Actinomycetota bacterium]